MSVYETPERDAAIDALLASGDARPFSLAKLRAHAGRDADLLFPGGTVELVEVWADLADRRMRRAAREQGIETRPGLTGRVEAVIMLRLDAAEPHRSAVRQGLEIPAAGGNAAASIRMTARTVDAIWQACGDRSADISWYTKRATLAAVYGPTLLYWVSGRHDREEVVAFLRRRLTQLGQLGRLLGRAKPRRPAPVAADADADVGAGAGVDPAADAQGGPQRLLAAPGAAAGPSVPPTMLPQG